MNRITTRFAWLLLLVPPAAAGCVLVQPLDSAVSDDDSGSAAGSTSSHAGATGSAGKSSGSSGAKGSSGATGSAGRGSAGSSSAGSSSGGGSATGAALFIGTWTIATGSTTIDCTGTPSTQPLTGSDIWAAGTDSDLVLDPSTTCPLKADITGRSAIGQPGFTCTTSGTDSTNNAPFTSTLDADDYSFVVSSNGKTATGMLSGTVTYTESGTSVPCTFSEQADYIKN